MVICRVFHIDSKHLAIVLPVDTELQRVPDYYGVSSETVQHRLHGLLAQVIAKVAPIPRRAGVC